MSGFQLSREAHHHFVKGAAFRLYMERYERQRTARHGCFGHNRTFPLSSRRVRCASDFRKEDFHDALYRQCRSDDTSCARSAAAKAYCVMSSADMELAWEAGDRGVAMVGTDAPGDRSSRQRCLQQQQQRQQQQQPQAQ